MSAGTCPKCEGEFHWYPATNEDGWRCCSCGFKPGEPDGYEPNLDVSLIEIKVGGLLMDLHNRDMIYMSNSCHGDGVTASVAASCRELNRFDQYTIIRLIFEGDSHGEYWAKIGDGVRSGNDTRDRCAGGKLSTCSSSTGNPDNPWRYSCSIDGCVCGGMDGLSDGEADALARVFGDPTGGRR